jgi:hypothetical protein
MALYLVNISPSQKTHDYRPLARAMETVQAKRALKTTWFLESNFSVRELTAELGTLVHIDDSFLVLEVVPSAAWAAVLLEGDSGPWLKARRP